ncbi:MAG: sigma-70 family RNA polymerase sigma factor [Myxococcota bacterium]
MGAPEETDLELCRRCLAGEAAALERLGALVDALGLEADLKQALLTRLLVERKLEHFSGEGSLRRWLKTVAVRLASNLARSTSREDAVEDEVLDALLPPQGAAESAVMRAQARAALREAVQHALDQLEPRERLFIQHHFLDGMTLSAIGALYSVAPSTVMRAIERSLALVNRAAHAHLRDVHRLEDASLVSLVRVGLT